MRLEDGDQAALEGGTSGGKRRAHFRRMMRIVVKNDSSRRLTLDLEAAIDAGKLRKRRGRDRKGDAEFESHSNRGKRVERHMMARCGDRHRAEPRALMDHFEAR